MHWDTYRTDLHAAMRDTVGAEDLDALARLAATAGRIHFYGNGASATMASHMACDWSRRTDLCAFAYTDPAWLTATGNDAGYDRVFADTLRFARPDDLVCCISASGRSPNILACAQEATQQRVVTLTGMDPANPLRQLGAVNVWVPSASYGIVETVHAAILHAWLDAYCELYVDKT